MPDGQYPRPTFRDLDLDGIGAVSTSFVLVAQGGAPFGYATLDGSGRVPSSQMSGASKLLGTWNASTNTPTLGDSGAGGVQGDYYIVATPGSTSIDGINSWALNDWIVRGTSAWTKQPNSGLPTSTLNAADGSKVQGDTGIMPDLVEWTRDSAGTIFDATDRNSTKLLQALRVFGDSTHNNLIATTGTITSANATTLALPGATFQAGDAGVPDLAGWIRGDNGQLLLGLTNDGGAVVKYIVATESVTAPNISDSASAPKAPTDALDITAYGAVGDMEDDFFAGTWTAGGNTLALLKYSGAITWSGTSITLTGLASTTSPGFAPDVAGQHIFISATDGSGVSQTTLITAWVAANQVTVVDNPSGAVTTANVNWPAFTADRVGKTIRVEGANASTTRGAYNNGTNPWFGTIATVVDGRTVTVTGPMVPNFSTTNSGRPARVSWGTSNRGAYISIGADLLANGVKYIYHPRTVGRGRTGYLIDAITGRGGLNDWYLNINSLGVPALAWMHSVWIGDPTVTALSFANDAEIMPRRVVPTIAQPPPAPIGRDLIAKKMLPRVTANSAISVIEVGDSLASEDITNQSAAWFATDHFETNIVSSNLGKTFTFSNIASVGAGWAELVDPGSGLTWVVPGTDLYYLSSGGTNDAWRMHPLTVQIGINLARGSGNDSGGRPPDIIMVTNHLMNLSVDPGSATAYVYQMHLFCQVLLRTMAHNQGIAICDQSWQSEAIMHGGSNFHRDLRQVPDVMGWALAPATPFAFMVNCYSWSIVAHITGLWTAIGSFRVSLSPMPGNEFVVDVDPATTHIRYEGRLWGRSCATTVTTLGSTITTAAGTAMATGTMVWVSGHNVINIQAGGCSGLTVGECLYLPGLALNGQHERTYVTKVVDDTHVVVDDFWWGAAPGSLSTPTFSGTVTPVHGGQVFLNDDARAGSDVFMAWGVGQEYRGKITGFTSANQATLSPAPPALTGQAVQMWIGRSCVPPVVTSVGSGGATVTIKASLDRDIFSLRVGGAVSTNFIFRGPIERWGNRYSPKVSITGAGVTCDFQNLYADRDIYFTPRGSIVDIAGSGDPNSGYGGSGVHDGSSVQNFITRRAYEALDWNAS